jgi:hypothetical protein
VSESLGAPRGERTQAEALQGIGHASSIVVQTDAHEAHRIASLEPRSELRDGEAAKLLLCAWKNL